MKSYVNVLISALAASALSLSLAGCSPDGTHSSLIPTHIPAINASDAPEQDDAVLDDPEQDDAVLDDAAQDDAVLDDSEQAAALERFVEIQRAQIPALLDANAGMVSDVRIDSRAPDSVIYTLTLAAHTDPMDASPMFDALVPTLQTACDTLVFPAMASVGMKGTMHAVYSYLNPDGSTLWEKTFTSS